MANQKEISSILTRSGSIYFIRLDLNNNFLYVNDLFSKIFGIKVYPDERKSFLSFLAIDDVDNYVQGIDYITETLDTLHVDLKSVRNDNSAFWTRWEFFPVIEDGALVYIEGVGVDITERKRAETEKVFAKKSLQIILDNTEEGFIVVSADMKILSFNQRANHFARNFLGKELKTDELIHGYIEKVSKILLDALIDVALSSRPHEMDLEWPNNGNSIIIHYSIRPIFSDAKQEGLIITSRDVTEARKAEQLLLESEEKYRFLFFSNPQPMWVFDQNTLEFIEVNDVAVRKYGYSREEFLSMTIRDIRPSDDVVYMLERVHEMRSSENNMVGSYERIWRHRKKDGSIIFVEIKSHSIIFNGRKGFLISINDVTALIEAEKSLAKSNERFELASRATSDAIWDVDFVNDKLHWGDGYERLFGYKLDQNEFRSDTWLGHIHPDDYQMVRKSFEATVANPRTTKWDCEYRYLRSDNSVAFVRDRGIIIRNADGKATRMIGAVQDITESKQYEEKLFRERNLLRTIIDTIPDQIFVKDREYRHVINNKAMVNIIGAKTEEETLGKTMADYFGPEASYYLETYDKVVIQEGKPIEIKEDKVVMPNGREIWYNTTLVPLVQFGEVVGLVGTSKDITIHKEIEESLRQSNEVFQMVSWATNDAIFDYNFALDICHWNEAFSSTFGYPIKETQYSWWASKIKPSEWRRVERKFEKVLKSIEPHFSDEFKLIDAKGNYRSVLSRAVILYESDGTPRRMIGTITDLTRMKQLQDQIEKQKIDQQRTITEVTIRAQEKERIEIGRELHDNINQILTTTKLYIDVAMHEPELQNEMLDRAMVNISSAIEEIRSLSRSLVPPSLGDIGIEEAIMEMISNLRMSQGIIFEFSQERLDSIDLSPDIKLMVFRIVQEQVNNILKHSKATRAEIKLSVTEKLLNITIEDNGIGFDTSKRSAGIGLNNIVSRAELHNGTMEVISSPGKGCILNVSIPVN